MNTEGDGPFRSRGDWLRRGILLLALHATIANGQTLPESLGSPAIRAIRPEDLATADLPLEAIVDDAIERLKLDTAISEKSTPGALDLRSARLYARGRTLLLDGQNVAAVQALQSAVGFQPQSPNAWRELGMAQIASNDAVSAASSLKRALSLGATTPRLLYILGSIDVASGRLESGIDYLAFATTQNPSAQDAALSPILDLSLGQALYRTGHLRAGNEAIERGVRDSTHVRNRSFYENELARIYPTRGLLMQTVADSWLRLGEPGRAAEAYQTASGLGVPIYDPVIAKQIYALVLDGRPVDAVDRLVRAFGDPHSRLDDRLIESIDLLDGASKTEFLRQLGALSRTAHATYSVHSWLARALARAQPGDAGRMILAGHLAIEPFDELALLDFFATIDEADQLASSLHALVSREQFLALPIGAIAAEKTNDVGSLLSALEEFADDPSVLARASILIAMEHPERALRSLASIQSQSAASHALRALSLDSLGLDSSAELAKLNSGRDRLLAAAVLRAAQQSSAALDVLETYLDTPGGLPERDQLEALSMWLDAAPHAAMAERGTDIARRLLTLDASNPQAIEALLHGSPELGASLLREQGGGSRLRRMVGAEQLFRRGERDQAERVLSMMALEARSTDRAVDLLARLWLGAGGIDHEPALDRGVALFDRLLDHRPGDASIVVARARLLEAQGLSARAVASLKDALARRATPMVARELEDMMLRDPSLAEGGRAMRDERLSHPDLSLGTRVELAADQIDTQKIGQALATLSTEAFDGVSLTRRQGAILVASLRRLGAQLSRDPRGPLRNPSIELLGRAIQLDAVLSRELHELRLALLATRQPLDMELIAQAAADASRSLSPAPPDQTILASVRSLISDQRLDEALGLIERLSEDIELSEPAGVELWVRLVVSKGDNASLRLLLKRVRDDASLRAMFPDTTTGTSDALGGDKLRGEIAFQIGTAHASMGQQDLALGDYELGLEYDERHPWCANNLGYSLLEQGGDLRRAERLIEIAYEQLSDNDSILDSLGWARYLQGVFFDEPGLDGQSPRLGAVTLLKQAVESGDDDAGGVVLDHYGDSLWRSGEHDQALEAWTRALGVVRSDLGELPDDIPQENPALVQLRDLERSLEIKIEATGADRPPPIAPIQGE